MGIAHALRGLAGGRWIAALASLSVLSGLNNGFALKVGSFVQQRVNSAYSPSSPLYLHPAEYSFLGSGLLLGVVASCGLSGLIIRAVGTRNAALLGELLAFGAAFFGFFASASWMLHVWRIGQGAGVGLCITAKPLFIAESSPPEWRGRLLVALAFCIVLGQAVAELIDWSAGVDDGSAWRVDIAVAAVFPAVLGVVLYLMPPTPEEERRATTGCWPCVAGRAAPADGAPPRPGEATPLKPPTKPAGAARPAAGAEAGATEWLGWPHGTMRALGLALLLILAKEGSAAGSLIAYAYQLLLAGRPIDNIYTLSAADMQRRRDAAHVEDMAVAAFQLLGSVLCFALIDRPSVGRRPVLIGGCVGSALGAALLSGSMSSRASQRLLPAALSTLGFFNQLVQGAFYPLTTELMPRRARLFLLGPIYGMAQLVSFCFTQVLPSVSTTALFAALAALSAVNAAALWRLLPETIPREGPRPPDRAGPGSGPV